LKILIYGINFTPELTGIGKYTGEMAAWLASRGHEVRVVTAHPYYPQWKVIGGAGYRREILDRVNVCRCPLYVPSKPTGLKRILHLASFALSSIPVMACQIFWKPNIVWVVEPALMCAPGALLTAKLSRANSWLHVQDLEVDAAFDLGLVRSSILRRAILLLERLLMNSFDKVSTISANMLSRLNDKGISIKNLVLFPNWVDTSLINPAFHDVDSPFFLNYPRYRSEWHIPQKATVVLYSGNIGEKQGLGIVIEAAKKLADRNDIYFILCGNGAAYNRLHKISRGMANIHWIPLQPFERLSELLSEADIHLLPQLVGAENLVMPSKLTGIFASGRPVVTTAEPGSALYQSVTHAAAGIIVPHNDVEAFSLAIVELADKPALRYELGRSARKYAIEHMDINSILLKFEFSLNQLNKKTP
jgi:colanic acid biosynthesis glycosyl transferase WcaI